MDQSATELRVEIAETRANLGETIEAIGDRVSPGRMMERKRNRLSRGFTDVKDRIMGTASSITHEAADRTNEAVQRVGGAPDVVRERTAGNPLVAGGVAFGLGVLIAAAIPPTRAERQVAATVGERIEPLKEEAAAMAREVAQTVEEGAKDAVQEVKQAASGATSHVSEAVRGDEGSSIGSEPSDSQPTGSRVTTPGGGDA